MIWHDYISKKLNIKEKSFLCPDITSVLQPQGKLLQWGPTRVKLKYIYAHMYCKVKQAHGHMLTLQVF